MQTGQSKLSTEQQSGVKSTETFFICFEDLDIFFVPFGVLFKKQTKRISRQEIGISRSSSGSKMGFQVGWIPSWVRVAKLMVSI